LLVWGLCIAAVFLVIVIGGTITFRRLVAARGEARPPSGQISPVD